MTDPLLLCGGTITRQTLRLALHWNKQARVVHQHTIHEYQQRHSLLATINSHLQQRTVSYCCLRKLSFQLLLNLIVDD